MKVFTIQMSNETFQQLKEFQEQYKGHVSATDCDVIRSMFWLDDLGSGAQLELQDDVKVTDAPTFHQRSGCR